MRGRSYVSERFEALKKEAHNAELEIVSTFLEGLERSTKFYQKSDRKSATGTLWIWSKQPTAILTIDSIHMRIETLNFLYPFLTTWSTCSASSIDISIVWNTKAAGHTESVI